MQEGIKVYMSLPILFGGMRAVIWQDLHPTLLCDLNGVRYGAVIPKASQSTACAIAYDAHAKTSYVISHQNEKWTITTYDDHGFLLKELPVPTGIEPVSGVFKWRDQAVVAAFDRLKRRSVLSEISASGFRDIHIFESNAELDDFLDHARRSKVQAICKGIGWFPEPPLGVTLAFPSSSLRFAKANYPSLYSNRMAWSPDLSTGVLTYGMLFGAAIVRRTGHGFRKQPLIDTMQGLLAVHDFQDFVSLEVDKDTIAITIRDAHRSLRSFCGKFQNGGWHWRALPGVIVARVL